MVSLTHAKIASHPRTNGQDGQCWHKDVLYRSFGLLESAKGCHSEASFCVDIPDCCQARLAVHAAAGKHRYLRPTASAQCWSSIGCSHQFVRFHCRIFVCKHGRPIAHCYDMFAHKPWNTFQYHLHVPVTALIPRPVTSLLISMLH